jgi:integrase
MAAKRRRRFGWIRKLPSGRWQASYVDPKGHRRLAPTTFPSKPEAGDWLTEQESLIIRREWVDPDSGRVAFGSYARRWIEERSGLRPRTAQMYRWVLKRYLESTFGNVYLRDIDAQAVRSWRRELLDAGVSQSMVAKAYRLLRAILNTAVDHDELLRRNPCRIRGAGDESPAERPVLTVGQVYQLAALIDGRYRALILVTTFGSLRFGEAAGLQRADASLDLGTIRIRQALVEVAGQGLVLSPPKSRAGLRTVVLPPSVVGELRQHIERYVDDGPAAFVFTGPQGAPLRRGNFNGLVKWAELVADVGVTGLHFHDLRHTGNTWPRARASARGI